MKGTELEEALKLNGLHVFTVKDVCRLTGKRPSYVYLMLSKSKLFSRIEKGLYCLKDTSPFEAASNIVVPSYISLLSALSYYGLVEQVPNIIKVVTTKRHKPLDDVQGMRVEFRSVSRKMLYGYRLDHGVSIAEPEKALVDAFYLNEDEHYAKEALSNGMSIGSISKEKLLKYAKMCGVKAVQKKISKLVNGND